MAFYKYFKICPVILCLRISSFYLTRHLKIGISLTYVEDIYDFGQYHDT